jgi:hypothetical protein
VVSVKPHLASRATRIRMHPSRPFAKQRKREALTNMKRIAPTIKSQSKRGCEKMVVAESAMNLYNSKSKNLEQSPTPQSTGGYFPRPFASLARLLSCPRYTVALL